MQMGGGYWKTDTVWCWQRIACASVVKISFGEIIDRWDREVAHLFIIEGAEELLLELWRAKPTVWWNVAHVKLPGSLG